MVSTTSSRNYNIKKDRVKEYNNIQEVEQVVVGSYNRINSC